MFRIAPRIASLLVFVFPAATNGYDYCLLDPQTTHTNGMPVASSTPCRANSVYWSCDPYRLGMCGGRWNCPCCNSICGYPGIGCCQCNHSGYPGAPCPPSGACVCGESQGFDSSSGTVLGRIPNDLGGFSHSFAPPAAPPNLDLGPTTGLNSLLLTPPADGP